jgi:hypothetical protein
MAADLIIHFVPQRRQRQGSVDFSTESAHSHAAADPRKD